MSFIERWPQTPTFSQVIGLVRQTSQPSEFIKSTIEVYLPKAIEIFCAKCFQGSKESTQSGEQQPEIKWREKKLEPKEEEWLKAKQLSQILGTSPSFAVLLIREYISAVYVKFNDSVSNVSLYDLIRFFYADEHAAYCFLAQILDICQDEEHPLHNLCVEVWDRKVENASFPLEPRSSTASPFSFGDLAMHMLKTILDNDGILTGWEPLSNDGKYDKLCQEVLELESYRLLWTLEILFLYHYSHSCSPSKLVDFVHLLWRMSAIMEPDRTWHWKCYLTFYGLLVEVLSLEECTDKDSGISSQEAEKEKVSKLFRDVDFTELYTQMESFFSGKNPSLTISIVELIWSVFLHVISEKNWQSLLLSEQQQQLWSSCARMHFSQAVSNGAIEQLDRIFSNTPFVNPYSLQETHGKLNGIFFGFLDTLLLSFIPRQLNASERAILNRSFVNTMKNTVPVIQRIWWIYQEPFPWKYNGYHSLLLYNLSLFPLDMQSSCQLLSGLVGDEWTAHRLFQFMETELPFYTSCIDANYLSNIQLLSWEQFREEWKQPTPEIDWFLSQGASFGAPVIWNGYFITQDGQSCRNCVGLYVESESKVIWRMQWNGWKYISYYFQRLSLTLEDSRQYDECIALLDMIHRLLFYGDSSCVDSVLNYIPEQLWIGSYRVVMESLLSAESSFGKDASELKRKQCRILQQLVSCMICFVVSSSTTRFPLLLSQHVEECCGWFPMLSEYSSILSSMIQLWTCLLHRGCDEIWEDDTKKNRIFSQVLYLLRTKRPIGSKLLWSTSNDILLYATCLLCLSYAPLEILFPLDWIKSLEHFCHMWLSRRRLDEERNVWLSSMERNILDWRWFDRQTEELKIQQYYSLLGYCWIHFIYRQNSNTRANEDILRQWWTTLANSRGLIRVLAFMAFNAQQFSVVHEQILKYVLLYLEYDDSNWPKVFHFLLAQNLESPGSSSSMIASRCLIQLFQALSCHLFHPESVPQVLWPEDEEANVLVNSFLFNIVSSDVCLSTLSIFVVCNGWKSDQRALSRSLISLPKSSSYQMEGFLKSKHMDFEWLSTSVDLLSTLKHRLVNSNNNQSTSRLLERGDGVRFLSLVSLLKEAWLSFGSLWLQDAWEKYGVWKLLLSFINKEWKESNIFTLLCEYIEKNDSKEYLDEMTGWLRGVAVLLEWFALEIFDAFRFPNTNEDENTTTCLFSLVCQELDLDGLEYFWSQVVANWARSFHSLNDENNKDRKEESFPHLYILMKMDDKRKQESVHQISALWYYETHRIIPGEYFYEVSDHPFIHWKDVEWLERMHRHTSRFQAMEKCIYSLYRLYFATMAVSKEKNRFYSFWSLMWNSILDYMSVVPCGVISEMDEILAHWLLDMAHNSKLMHEIYPLEHRHIVLLEKTWKQSKNQLLDLSFHSSSSSNRRRWNLYHLWQRPWEKSRKHIQMHLLYTLSIIIVRQQKSINAGCVVSESNRQNIDSTTTTTTTALYQFVVQVLQDVMMEEEEWIDCKAADTHAWSALLCSLPLEYLQSLHPNMLKEWCERILWLWKEWISVKSIPCEEKEHNRMTLLLSNRWSVMNQLILTHIHLWLSIPEVSWKENFLQQGLSYAASLDCYPNMNNNPRPIRTFYDPLLQQRQPGWRWHRYWIHQLAFFSLHSYLSSPHDLSCSPPLVVLQWISTHVSCIEESLYLFPRSLTMGEGDIMASTTMFRSRNDEKSALEENPHSHWNFARIEEIEQLCTLLHSLYGDSQSLFRHYLPDIYHHLLGCLYRYLYQAYRFLQTGGMSSIEWWIRPISTLEHEQYNSASLIDTTTQHSSPGMKVPSGALLEEKGQQGSSPLPPSFPSTPQAAASPVFGKRRLELSPKRLALTPSPERKKGYKSIFGQRVLYSLMRSYMLAIRCWKYALLQQVELLDGEAGLFLSSQRPSLGIFLAIPIMLVPYSFSSSWLTLSSARDDRMTCYLDNIVNDCFLIVYIFGRQYEQSSLSCQKNMPPWKLKEEIAKRWFPWMENIQQHGWKADELDPHGRMRMSSSSHNQHDEENNPQTEINTGLRKRPAHTEETRNTDNDSSVEKRTNASLFDCHICFDSPNDPVVTPCGHLYCWSCIYKWMVAHPECPSCPLCKSSIDKDKIIPIYGRNEEDKVDPRTKHVLDNNIPARPSGHRTEIPPRPSSSTTTGGTAAYHLPHSPYYGNPFYSGPFSSAVHHSNFGPFSVSAFGPFPSLFGLQFTYPPPPSSHVSSQNGASVAEGMTEEQANQAFVSRLLLVMGLLIILCLLFV